MRRVNRSRISTPIELQSLDCINHRGQIIADPAVKAISDLYRGLTIDANGLRHFSVVEALKSLYKNKCAYCEKFAHNPKIDHHRPKGRVVGTGANNRGYYWLCYEWTNLLPTCTNCNEIGAKGSKFPVSGTRNDIHPTTGTPPSLHVTELLYPSTFNVGELPELLHPEYCFPHRHFNFDRSGRIFGLSHFGNRTIEAIRLDNEDLNGWRRTIYDQRNAELLKIIRRHFRSENATTLTVFETDVQDWVLDLVIDSQQDEGEYTLFKKVLVRRVDHFFIEPLQDVYRGRVRLAIANALTLISGN